MAAQKARSSKKTEEDDGLFYLIFFKWEIFSSQHTEAKMFDGITKPLPPRSTTTMWLDFKNT
ncbi:hypothetical protein QTP88_028440 [Uroleucon formosanum]